MDTNFVIACVIAAFWLLRLEIKFYIFSNKMTQQLDDIKQGMKEISAKLDTIAINNNAAAQRISSGVSQGHQGIGIKHND